MQMWSDPHRGPISVISLPCDGLHPWPPRHPIQQQSVRGSRHGLPADSMSETLLRLSAALRDTSETPSQGGGEDAMS